MPASQPASQRNELQRVNVVRGTDEIRVEMNARGAVTPKLSTADSPARLVVDLPGTVMATGQSHITVGSAGVKGVRIAMDGQTPPTTRVVVDLEHACRYELDAVGGWEAGADAAHGACRRRRMRMLPKTVAEATPAPADKIMSPFAPRVMEVSDAEGAGSCRPALRWREKAAATATSDFVFVEPTFEAKKAAVDATDEPGERAQEAAAKFSDKTAAELLPVSMNAAPGLAERFFQHGNPARGQSGGGAESAGWTATGCGRSQVHG